MSQSDVGRNGQRKQERPFVIYAFAASTFAIGTTEFVIVGLLPGIATDLNVSVPTAGLLVGLYALSITLGTPVFSAFTGRFPRRGLILSLIGLFTATNLTAAIAPDYFILLTSHVVMAVCHGVFFGWELPSSRRSFLRRSLGQRSQ